MNSYTDLEAQVAYGLDTVDPARKIEVPLKDLLFAYQTIGLLINFFHQPMHFPTLESVKNFLGLEGDDGAYRLLSEIYYKRLRDVWPPDIRRAFDESRFDNPNAPYYYRTESETS